MYSSSTLTTLSPTSEHSLSLSVRSVNLTDHLFSLAALCHQSISNSSIVIIKNDEYTLHELRPFLKYFSVIVVGPGPGSPDISQDIGVVKDLWKLDEEDVLPIFGVCLGLQSLSIEFGATLKRLRVVKHGQMSHVNHVGMDLFTEVRPFQAVRYHSLHVDLAKDGEVKELAWADEEENGRVMMAVWHNTRPFWPSNTIPNQFARRVPEWKSSVTFGGWLKPGQKKQADRYIHVTTPFMAALALLGFTQHTISYRANFQARTFWLIFN